MDEVMGLTDGEARPLAAEIIEFLVTSSPKWRRNLSACRGFEFEY
jgi:hypothetical protein